MTLLEAETAYAIALDRLENGQQPNTQDEDLALLRQAAEAGYAPAQYAFGNAMDDLKGAPLSALPWFLAAAWQGHADAHYRLRELYARHKTVRTRAGELMRAEELERMKLANANFIIWFFGREPGYNSHFGQTIGMLVGLAIASPLAWYNLADFAAGWDGIRPWHQLWELMLARQAGVYFGLNFFVGSILDWKEPGSTAYSPLMAATLALLLFHVALSLLIWGGYELCHNAQLDTYWWVPGAAAALAGATMTLIQLYLFTRWFAHGATSKHP